MDGRVYLKPIPDVWQFGLPVEGAWRPRDKFWTRRLAAGEVVEATPPVETPVASDETEG